MRMLIISGRVGSDPDMRTTNSGKSICSFRMVDNKFKGNNEKDELWVRVMVFDKQADICQRYLHKGSFVTVVGEPSMHTYEQNGKTHTSLEMFANKIEFGPKEDGGGQQGGYQQNQNQYGNGGYLQGQGNGGYQQQQPPPSYNPPPQNNQPADDGSPF